MAHTRPRIAGASRCWGIALAAWALAACVLHVGAFGSPTGCGGVAGCLGGGVVARSHAAADVSSTPPVNVGGGQARLLGDGLVDVVGEGASLPAYLYQYASYLYHLSASQIGDVSYTATGSRAGQRALMAGSVDFAAADNVDSATLPAGVTAVPTVAAAVALMYNVDGVGGPAGDPTGAGATGTPLVLDADTMAGVFGGSISRWNHPSIAALNPALALPDADIIVVARNDSSGTTSIFTRALSTLNATFAATVGNGTRVSWPLPASRLVLAQRSVGVSSAVAVTPNSIGYNVLAEALQYGLPYARFKASDGTVVAPGSASLLKRVVSFSPNSFGAVVNDNLAPAVDAQGLSTGTAWPIAGYSYLLLRHSYIRPGTTCEQRIATRSFWTWFYAAAPVATFASQFGFATIPSFVNQQVLDTMQAAFTCRVATNSSVVTDGDLATLYGFGVSMFAEVASFTGLAYEAALGAQALLTQFTPLPVGTAPPLFTASNASWALHVEGMTAGWLPSSPGVVGAGTSGTVITVPLGVVSLRLVHNLLWLPGAADGDTTTGLVLSEAALAGIFSGSITLWNDPAIRATNPHVSYWPPDADAGIKPVLRTDTCAENFILSNALATASPEFGAAFGGAVPFTSWPSTPAAALPARTNHFAASLVDRTPNAIGYVATTVAVTLADGVKVAAINTTVDAAGSSGVGAQTFVVHLTTASQSACSVGPADAGAPLPRNGQCWPLSARTLLSVPAQFSSTAAAAAEAGTMALAAVSAPGAVSAPAATVCSAGSTLAAFANWLLSTSVQGMMSNVGVVALTPSGQAAASLVIEDGIRCNGKSILNPEHLCTADDLVYTVSECEESEVKYTVTFAWKQPKRCLGGIALPNPIREPCDYVPWGSKTSVSVLVGASLCAISIACLLAWMARHRALALVKYMQPTFCFVFLSAGLLALLGLGSLMGPNTDVLCVVRAWATNLPITAMFAALFAKMYRVWRIFALKSAQFKRTVVRNKDLGTLIAACVATMMALLTAWTVFGDIKVHYSTKQLAFGAELTWSECSSSVPALSGAVYTFQALLLVVGVFLSVQSWHVESTVAEARPMAVAIYNIAFVAGLVILLSILFASERAAVVGLVAFAVVWSVEASALAVFGPRLVWHYRNPGVNAQLGSNASNSSSGGTRPRRSLSTSAPSPRSGRRRSTGTPARANSQASGVAVLASGGSPGAPAALRPQSYSHRKPLSPVASDDDLSPARVTVSVAAAAAGGAGHAFRPSNAPGPAGGSARGGSGSRRGGSTGSSATSAGGGDSRKPRGRSRDAASERSVAGSSVGSGSRGAAEVTVLNPLDL